MIPSLLGKERKGKEKEKKFFFFFISSRIMVSFQIFMQVFMES